LREGKSKKVTGNREEDERQTLSDNFFIFTFAFDLLPFYFFTRPLPQAVLTCGYAQLQSAIIGWAGMIQATSSQGWEGRLAPALRH
jgi:hypothetical protein